MSFFRLIYYSGNGIHYKGHYGTEFVQAENILGIVDKLSGVHHNWNILDNAQKPNQVKDLCYCTVPVLGGDFQLVWWEIK